MNRALFLDRDGVININTGYCNKVADFRFVPGIEMLADAYWRNGYIIVVVTNQAGVAHGFLSREDLDAIHLHMRREFYPVIHAVYACTDLDGPMRKPEPGMLLQAQREHHIDMPNSVLIGDNITDIEAGRRAGVGCCILIPSNRLDAVPLPR